MGSDLCQIVRLSLSAILFIASFMLDLLELGSNSVSYLGRADCACSLFKFERRINVKKNLFHHQKIEECEVSMGRGTFP